MAEVIGTTIIALLLIASIYWMFRALIYAVWDVPLIRDRDHMAISFRQFKALYAVAPEKWEHGSVNICNIYYENDLIEMRSLIDWILYVHFIKKEERIEADADRQAHKADLLKRWQGDINKSYEEIKEVLKDDSD